MATPQRTKRHMPAIVFLVESPLMANDEDFERTVRAALESIVMVNLGTMRTRRLPPLYRSGVRYRSEKPGVESFVDAAVVLRRGFGDCAHLSAYRVAELRAAGEKAALHLTCKHTRRGRLFHVTVRRQNGRIEDPSRLLGMR